MKNYYVDLHIHIGRTWTGKPVKITGAKSLTFTNIIEHARHEKGLNMVGIIDSHSPEVILEMENLIESGDLVEHPDGGLVFGDLTVIPGSELEIYDEGCNGPIHLLGFFPTLAIMREFSSWLSKNLKNVQLSSQRVYVTGLELQKKIKDLGGIFIPAHVFTPFKSLYGKGVNRSLTEVFDPNLIDGIELGLSSDTDMADQIGEIHKYTFVTNSDAHSLAKIAREYQVIAMEEPTFKELQKALNGEDGRGVVANYGLDPLLGKYHKTVCAECLNPAGEDDQICTLCGNKKIIKGVADRILELKTAEEGPSNRPPYVHQVPLEFIPGLGPKLLEKLVNHFGSEMAILHEVPAESLKEVVPPKIAELIMKAREGEIHLSAGGGGKYGKIADQ
ncbi:TIGR00375 family protein [Bacillus salipaludis]|uniref:Endonuclease Q family protein n=1 Tax=Bacillus salipaludis TaxID=2547811 RepID=A0A4R5VPP3_9BACI|nr:endonuclease Q family protein [Bacillus salipaludis]MDQ6599539.1 endonuclease Q family protein [Bacillus salipaludis]TDK60190.1 TIGR00375 family protein [Bacillus salipaludis]